MERRNEMLEILKLEDESMRISPQLNARNASMKF